MYYSHSRNSHYEFREYNSANIKQQCKKDQLQTQKINNKTLLTLII